MPFDLFKLHSEKDSPRGWIWVYFDCSLLKKHYLRLLKYKSQNIIAREISRILNCGFSTVGKHLIKLKDIYDAVLKIKKGKIQDIILELNKFNISYTTIYKYLYILEESGLIYKEIEEHIGPKNGWHETIYYLS